MELPKQPLPPVSSNPKILTLYGQRKIGKSTICAKLPNHCFLVVDRGGEGNNFINCCRIPITTYDSFMNVTSEIVKQGRPYKYVILDTVSSFEELCEDDATKEYKSSNAGKNFKGRSVLELVGPDYNPGYLWLRNSYRAAMAKLVQCADHIIVIAHIADKFLKTETTDKGKKDSFTSGGEIELSGKMRAMLCTASDAIGFVYRTSDQDGIRQKIYVSFKTKEHVNMGSNCNHLNNQEFELDDWSKIYLPDSETTSK